MALENGRFIQQNYHEKETFASFLPGISGEKGIPTWCYYVNRGQGVVSFGTENKDHAIMEFFPAHQAYQQVGTLGFRSFLKVNGHFLEPFQGQGVSRTLSVSMGDLTIEEVREDLGLEITVEYETLPLESLGGLLRKVTLKNISQEDFSVEFLDGMPALIPYGIDLRALKETGQTMKAWMQVEDVEKALPYYRTRIATKDVSEVLRVDRGNYYFTFSEEQTLLPMVVDPKVVFGHDVSYKEPLGFMKKSLGELLKEKQRTMNELPCAFSGWQGILAKGEKRVFHSVSGMAENKAILEAFSKRAKEDGYFSKKTKENEGILEALTKVIHTETGHEVFDAYAKQTYLDNVMRGGEPLKIGDKVLHVYARKHGDLERDYNFFSLEPSYYAQGNGNYRDVNQNRRSDVRFHPFVEEKNIKTFYNLLQLDGYNPLVVKPTIYEVEAVENLLDFSTETVDKEKLRGFFAKPFSPGTLLRFLQEESLMNQVDVERFLTKTMAWAKEVPQADFHEGYWTDHFVYNLDQVEAFLSIYPERKHWLLFEDATYTYRVPEAKVLPRKKRYVLTKEGLRQYRSVEVQKGVQGRIRKADGLVYQGTLAQKFLVLLGTKFAALDPSSRGLEMEAGKPGWYDALNGLPGIFGSSVTDACELLRFMRFFQEALSGEEGEILVPKALNEFLEKIHGILKKKEALSPMDLWVQMNDAKEAYREEIYEDIIEEEGRVSIEQVDGILTLAIEHLTKNLSAAVAENQGLCPTYYYHEVTAFHEGIEGYEVEAFERKSLPLFLEGQVKYLGLLDTVEEKRAFAKKVRESALYDEKLKMYKVNASLEEVSYDVGRAKAFTPGWLENESIWLHMSYKYLLALLKEDLHEEFHEALATMGIPFLDEETYGRSILENSSFIASSANPDEKIHGRGFVARLSGSTAEFLEIWQGMFFGFSPFSHGDQGLTLRFQPSLPGYLLGEKKTIKAMFLGTTSVAYDRGTKKHLLPGTYQVGDIMVTYEDGRVEKFHGEITGPCVEKLRQGQGKSIQVQIL